MDQTPQLPAKAPFAFLGVCCAVGVSSLYYCQPLLPAMGKTFGVDASKAGLVAVATQVGYALGLLCFVPLGDILERRALMTRLYAAVAIALFCVAAAPTLPLLILASAVMGALACVTHIALPIAPDLAQPKERGRAIGIVMTGLLLGVLLARTFAGWINDLSELVTHRIAGWRIVFALAGVISIGFSFAMPRVMPHLPPKQNLRYGQAMRSLWTVFREEPMLRESCLIGALVFGAFSVFWNTFAFMLGTHGLGAGVAGSFGLVGAGGALIAGSAGKISDRRGPRFVMSLAVAFLAASYVLIYITEKLAIHAQAAGHLRVLPYLAALAFAVVIMDIGAQGSQIANQSRIFALRPEARSRINTVYMVTYFTGAAISSALSTIAWQHFGVDGICVLAALLIAAAVVRHLTGDRNPYRRPASVQDLDPTLLNT